MIPLSLTELAKVVDGQVRNCVPTDCADTLIITSVCTDSRQLAKDDLFIALKGPNFDGHRFVEQAASIGCTAALVESEQQLSGQRLPQIVVNDCYQAMGKLAAYVKATLNPKTVAITGSSGKTTVKEMVAAILSRLGTVLATKGNFNNEIGVPLTLLRLEPQHEFAVIELGANHIGEIAYTTGLTKPDVAVINNIAAAHLEGFGDMCGVARAKGEIFEGLGPNGVALYNQDTPYAHKWQWRLENKTVRKFSCENTADVYCTNIRMNGKGCSSFTLNTDLGNIDIDVPVPGKHNVCNAVAAATIALEFGASLTDIQAGLSGMSPVKGRLNLIHLVNDFTLIDDSYNANVESTKAAVELLASYPGRSILVLGDMAELGEEARAYHQEIGEHALHHQVDNLLTLGVLSQSTSAVFEQDGRHFSSRDLLVEHLANLLKDEQQPITVLVKGSRSARMELVVNDIKGWRENANLQNNNEGSKC
ncbi:UDP-N-acetylmuramoyl-tripeptide--D-alanyl-D-alanine ligase [Thalassotalea sp. ND16A]|uniref:UDP-N-acetylmuramoyl-tripeptide--D-alanyl-D- alanine ligase n=1 Tax=Thalassotalea sp. ND16A TaxID=1535422 RepID=UPI00051D37B4|nr:UDP-N-acetylmuramoyl-tripeptide--D-alanyl-D-alanine ligase [Thalassotalea sp. ND16A]KGK01173.1 UDP-N-acetylmuramoyl-tripeptide--D-alanyl-D-alanine ligase [Thalassotalea sp. ND16A]